MASNQFVFGITKMLLRRILELQIEQHALRAALKATLPEFQIRIDNVRKAMYESDTVQQWIEDIDEIEPLEVEDLLQSFKGPLQ